MAFYSLQEAEKNTQNKKDLLIAKAYISALPIMTRIPFDSTETVKYGYRYKKGVAGVGSREVNGNLHQGTNSKVYDLDVTLKIYNEVRNIDRLVAGHYGNLLENGVVQAEMADVLESFALLSLYDFINAVKANDKYNGLLALAVEEGNNISVDGGAVAKKLDETNVYDNLIALQGKVKGLASSKLFLMNRDRFNKVQMALKKSGLETKIATDDFGADYISFNGSTLMPLDAFVIDNEDESVEKVFIPKVAYEGTENTDRIICVNFGQTAVHGVRLSGDNNEKIKVKELKDCGAGEHPMVDLEDGLAIVDRVQGSIAVLEGIL